MNIAIVGGGSIGGLFAAKMVKSGIRNILVHSRGKMGEKFLTTGITIQGLEDFTVPTDSFFPSIQEVGVPQNWESSADLVIVSGKSTSSESLIEVANYLGNPRTIFLAVSNGIGWEEILADKFGKSRVIAATTTHAAIRQENGSITYTGIGKVTLGSINGASVDSYFEIMKLFEKSGLFPEWVDDGSVAIWEKAIINAAINPLAAITGVKNGELLNGNNWFTSLEIMYEACSVARAHGVNVRPDDRMESYLKLVLESTRENTCSMGQDLIHGRVTEIDFINGKIVEIAELYGIPVPFNRLLTTLIKMSEPKFV